MKSGKLDNRLLEEIVFKSITHRRPEILVRPSIGEDCAVADFGPYQCVLSTDPITAAVDHIGRLAVTVSCNDVAANGVEPLGLLLACLLPEGTTEEEIRAIMEQAGAEAARLGVEIVGGHTEITGAVRQPVIVSTAFGRSARDVRRQPVRPGDRILMTGTAGMEGTGILATDHAARLAPHLTVEELAEAAAMLERIDVVREGTIAGRLGARAMHDVTEGGILGAVWEIAEASRTGVRIDRDAIPVAPVTAVICRSLGLDPLRLISSGSMVIAAGPAEAAAITAALAAEGIRVTDIGCAIEGGSSILTWAGGEGPLDPPGRDELYKVVFADEAE